MARKAIQIPEGDQPLLTFDVPSGGVTGSTIALVVKASKDVSDGSGTSISGSVVNDTQFTVQVNSTLAAFAAGVYWYKVVLTKSSRPVTRQWGPWEVINT